MSYITALPRFMLSTMSVFCMLMGLSLTTHAWAVDEVGWQIQPSGQSALPNATVNQSGSSLTENPLTLTSSSEFKLQRLSHVDTKNPSPLNSIALTQTSLATFWPVNTDHNLANLLPADATTANSMRLSTFEGLSGNATWAQVVS